ncbi:MAG: nitroreductase family protein [Mediterranea sp.]|jgi:nitroreductase|nr:nitroreductase family protein [Mediterranea sp.]
MNLKEILEHRRAIRKYDPAQPIDENIVRECLRMSTLAPTSSNMQLWECYHVTDTQTLAVLSHACLGQSAASTARQMVVFVTRQDKYRAHAKAVLDALYDEIKDNSPAARQTHRMKVWKQYYGKLMPFEYVRGFGLIGLFRKLLAQTIGLFRPIVRQVSEQEVNTVVHKSCALVVQTFMLAMSEAGYDTCPIEGFDSRLVKKALHLPHHTGINMIISCGIRLPEGVWGERFRLPFEEFYHEVK